MYHIPATIKKIKTYNMHSVKSDSEWLIHNNGFCMGDWGIGFIVKSTHHIRLYQDYSVNPTFIISRKNS